MAIAQIVPQLILADRLASRRVWITNVRTEILSRSLVLARTHAHKNADNFFFFQLEKFIWTRGKKWTAAMRVNKKSMEWNW